jgi:hypothetical protein
VPDAADEATALRAGSLLSAAVAGRMKKALARLLGKFRR